MTRGQTPQIKKAFLAAFAETGNVSASCRRVGVQRKEVYRWREHDETFAEAWQTAEVESLERLEQEAWRRAVQGTQRLKFGASGRPVVDPETGEPYREYEYSDTLLIFLLKARDPRKYRDQRVEVTGEGGGPVQVSAPDLRAQIAAEVGRIALRLNGPPLDAETGELGE